MAASSSTTSSPAAVVSTLLGAAFFAQRFAPGHVHLQGAQPLRACARWNASAVITCHEANEALLRLEYLQTALADARAEIEVTRTLLAAAQARTTIRGSWGECVVLNVALVLAVFVTWSQRHGPKGRESRRGRRMHAVAASSHPGAATRETWALDGLPPPGLLNARSLAGQIMTDARHGRTEHIAALLDAARVNTQQSAQLLAAVDLAHGNTALMLAAKNGHGECCALLLARGADPLVTNRRGQTAANLARDVGLTMPLLRPAVRTVSDWDGMD